MNPRAVDLAGGTATAPLAAARRPPPVPCGRTQAKVAVQQAGRISPWSHMSYYVRHRPVQHCCRLASVDIFFAPLFSEFSRTSGNSYHCCRGTKQPTQRQQTRPLNQERACARRRNAFAPGMRESQGITLYDEQHAHDHLCRAAISE